MKEKPCVDHDYCVSVLNLIIDGEANELEKTFFNTHVKECLECSEYYSIDQAIREAIRKKLEKKEAPQDLIHLLRIKFKESTRS
jgi:anti-sigma factor (TIGR02949 family)